MKSRGGGGLAYSVIPLLVAAVGSCKPAYASLVITPTFDPTLTVSEKASINSAIAALEADITSVQSLNVAIYFGTMGSGLAESITSIYGPSYFDFYNAYKAVAISPDQLTALASLGSAPVNSSSANPVNGTTIIYIASAEARNLGFSGDFGGVGVNSNFYDGEVLLNTSITSPPNSLSGNYSLQYLALRQIDEVLGIGGPGSMLGSSNQATGVGALDLYRYSGPGTRSYTTSSAAVSYFSINGGGTALSYFNQQAAGDYGDWQSGLGPQVQDAFATPGINVLEGASEIAAFEAIGYQVITPEPSTIALMGLGLVCFGSLRAIRRTTKPDSVS